MSANARRGEISAEIDGKPYRLCLTLGALADLESAFGAGDLNALAERFGTGRLSAKDMMEIIAAGMRGGGAEIEAADVGRMQGEGGLGFYAQVVTRLLAATFGMPQDTAA